MADESAPPSSNSADGNPPNRASAPAPAQAGDEQTKEVSPKSVFANTQPIREDQVQNAVKFLSHPRVKGSPVTHRRNFLERKGLTKEEIDEAFRRFPDPSPAVANDQAANTNQYGQHSANSTVVNPSQVLQPPAAAPHGVMATVTRRFHWSYALIAIGLFAATGCGTAIIFKKAIFPRFKSWVRKVASDEEDEEHVGTSSRPSPAEEAAAAAKAAAAAAADVARASQEMLISKTEEKNRFAEFMNLLDIQLQEMRSMRNSIRTLEGQVSTERSPYVEEYQSGSIARSRQPFNGRREYDSRSVRSSSPPVSADPSYPKPFMEAMSMSMLQRGERPPNYRPWETGQPPSSANFSPQPSLITEGFGSSLQGNGMTSRSTDESAVRWWQQQQQNVSITDAQNDNGLRTASNNGEVPIDQPPQRRWIPPQPPPVALPEAADAIRRPKSSGIRERPADEVEVARPVSEIDELQRITRIAESGAGPEMNGGGSDTKISESDAAPEMNGGGSDVRPVELLEE